MLIDEEKIQWYVVGSMSIHQEIKTRDGLRHAGIESYVPMCYEAQRVRDRIQRKAKPAITGLVFAHTSISAFKQYTKETNAKIFLRKSAYSHHQDYLVVNEQQMRLFINLTTSYADNVTYYKPEEITLHEGELVEITLGTQTYQAEIKRLAGKRGKELVVEIPDVTIASIKLTPDIIRLIKQLPGKRAEARRQQRESARNKRLQQGGRIDERKSKNLELDKKALFDTAFRLLFVIRDEYQDELEYHLAKQELRRIRERLLTFKGVTAAQEGELALAMFLANKQLNIDVDESIERLQAAIASLQDTSMLKKRMRFFLARLTNDEETLSDILTEVKTWNRLTLSDRQKTFLEEIRLAT
ncbi:MAG: hypothetical protein K5683_08275 [Prevotella sp.]|nr:hypothetical protein [Prevotella sp.]